MNVLLPLWVTLILFSCYGNIRSDDGQEEEEATSMAFPDSSVTPTPDYDYNATFDYYLVTFNQSLNLTEEEETTTIPDSSVTPTPDYDYDYNATFDYYYVTFNQSQNLTEEEETTTIQNSSVTPTPDYDYDNATFDYYLVTFNQSQNLTEVTMVPQEVRDGCRSLRHQSWIISTLLVSLAAFSL